MADDVSLAPVPPQNLDAEESILGACLISESAIGATSEVVLPEDFYRESHGRIYRTILSLYAAGQPVDAITVADRLDADGILAEVGGVHRVHELAALVPSTSNAAHYAGIVREMATFRGLTAVGEQVQRLGWERPHPASECVDHAEQLVFGLARSRVRTDLSVLGDDLDETWRRLEELAERGESVIGVPSGYDQLDRVTSGFQDGNLVVVAGRPSMGKTGFATGIASHVAIRLKRPVGFFTLEMSRPELHQRLLAAEGMVDLLRIRNGSLGKEDWRRLSSVASLIRNAPIYVEDARTVTMTEIRTKARRLALRQPDLALIVIDYLQLMSSGLRAENRVQEISQISRSLKMLAGELGVPVVALSQLSRQVEQRHDKRPLLSDLRESGSIEQDADLVVFLYRDEYYNPEDAVEANTAGVAEAIIAKHRNGPTDTVKLAFVKQHAKFGNLLQERG